MKNIVFCLFIFISSSYLNLNAICKYESFIISDPIDSGMRLTKMNNQSRFCGSFETRPAVWDFNNGLTILQEFPGWIGWATDINDNNFVTGYLCNLEQKLVISFLWNPWLGEFNFGPYDVVALAINSHNQVVGRESNPSKCNSFIWDSEGFSMLRTTNACDINDHGKILDSTFEQEIRVLTGANISIIEINNEGAVIGNATLNKINSSISTAFSFLNGKVKLLPHPKDPSRSTYALSINNYGKIVGYFRDSNGPNIACIWEDGKIFELNTLVDHNEIEINYVYKINDNSEILARGGVNGKNVELLLKPIKDTQE